MTNTSTANWNYNNDYCQYRLPCGYCKELNRACPMIGSTTTGSVGTVIINPCTTTGNIDREADND